MTPRTEANKDATEAAVLGVIGRLEVSAESPRSGGRRRRQARTEGEETEVAAGDSDAVARWLVGMNEGFEPYAQSFQQAAVDGKMLCTL